MEKTTAAAFVELAANMRTEITKLATKMKSYKCSSFSERKSDE